MPESESKNKKDSRVDEQDSKKKIKKDDELSLEEEGPKIEITTLKTKHIPAIITLVAGFIASVMSLFQRFPLKNSLLFILVTMLVFLVIGNFVKFLLDMIKIETVIEEESSDEAQEGDEMDEEYNEDEEE